MKQTYAFLFPRMGMGGTPVLIHTLGAYMAKRDYFVVVYCASIDKDFEEELRKNHINIRLSGKGHWNSLEKLELFLHDLPNCARVVTFTWWDYSRVQLKSEKLHISVILYGLHPDTIPSIICNPKRLRIFHPLFSRAFRNMIRKMIANHFVVCMDEMCMDAVCNYFGLSKNMNEFLMIRIPVDTDVFDKSVLSNKMQDKSKYIRVLSIGRAFFPEKGYLLGLINLFKDGKLPNNIELEIISHGRDYHRLEEAWNNCPDEIKERIKLHGRQLHSKLKQFFANTDFYFGDGTTLLDASVHGVVAIPVEVNTEKVLADRFFFEDYHWLKIGEGSEEGFQRILSKCCSLSHEQYVEMAIKNYNVVRENYGVDICVSHLDNIFDNLKARKVPFGLKLVHLLQKMKGLIFHRY